MSCQGEAPPMRRTTWACCMSGLCHTRLIANQRCIRSMLARSGAQPTPTCSYRRHAVAL